MKLLHLRKAIGLTFFALIFSALGLMAQTITVRGSVKDQKGENLPGVNVVLQGTLTGTVTGTDGNFNFQVPANGTLVFSYIGYKSKNIPIRNQQIINVVLEPDVLGLDEFVVVGYGTQRKSDITGSIASVDVAKIRDVPAANISRALQGKIAGVEIQSTSTRPGGSTQIRIRGNRSLAASNDPLLVVDGIPFGGSLNDISSDDIASIEVLKDASATVIYGSRGSNGVILITTKRGTEGDLKVSYNGYQGLSTVARKYNVFSAEEFINLRTAAGYTNYLPVEKESMLLGRETDWQDLVYQTGLTSNHELTLSAGTSKTKYAISGGYYRETGVLPHIAFTRYSLRAAVDRRGGKRIKIGLTTMSSAGITDGQSANPMFQLVCLSPLTTAYNLNGTIREQPMFDTDDYYSPLTLQDKARWKEQNRRFASFNTLYGELQILTGLKYRLNLGLDVSDGKYNNFYGSDTPFRNGLQNQATVQGTDNFAYTMEHLLNFDRQFGEKHRLGITGMFSVQESETTGSRVDALNIPVNYLQYNNLFLAGSISAPSGNNFYSKWGIVSYMARANYAFDDKYLLTITGRADGSSRLAPGNKWHYYPAAALGWIISKEKFMQNLRFVSNLKLRAGYGQTSNTSVNPYSTLGGLSGTFYSFGDTGVKGYFVSTLPNSKLSWEYTTTTNIGLDFGFLEGRISGSVDAYMQQTFDLLLGKQLPASTGVPGTVLTNVGKTENRGLEFVLNGIILSPKVQGGFLWEVNANLFLNREKIVALADPTVTKDVGNGWFVGQPTSAIYDYVKVGIWQLSEAEEAAKFGAKPGDIKLLDFAGGGANLDEPDGRISDADRRILGAGQPDYQGGLTSTFRFKGFDFSVVGYYRMGGMIISTLHMPADYVNRLDGRRNQIKVDYWTPTNPTNEMPRPNAAFDAARTGVLGYFDGSFIKIRSINFGYEVDKRLLRVLGPTSSLRIFASVADPFLLYSPYVDAGGVDPEPNRTGATISGGEGVPARALKIGLNTPPTRRYIIGINYKF